MYDMVTKIAESVALTQRTINTNTNTDGAIIDLKNFDAANLTLLMGAITDGSYAVQLFHGDQSNLSDATQATVAVDGVGDILGDVSAITSAKANTTQTIGYIGNKRYIRLRLVSTGVTTGGAFSCAAILSRALHQPV